jgi:ribosomal protein S18 acetylase RimI-like enzyme
LVEVVRSGAALPAPAQVAELYALSTGGDAGETAELFATLYDLALDRSDVVAVTAREVGELVGFGYGHRWLWAEQDDDWSKDLAQQLGDDAQRLEHAFAVQLLAVHPKFTHRGLGFELLKQLMVASASGVHWLQLEDADSPALRLFRRMGYRPLGDGAQVLVHG